PADLGGVERPAGAEEAHAVVAGEEGSVAPAADVCRVVLGPIAVRVLAAAGEVDHHGQPVRREDAKHLGEVPVDDVRAGLKVTDAGDVAVGGGERLGGGAEVREGEAGGVQAVSHSDDGSVHGYASFCRAC